MLARVAKKTAEDVANLRLAGLTLGHGRGVEEGATLLAMLDVALLLEDPQCGQDRVVGQGFVGGDGGYQVADGRLAAVPEQLISLSSASVSVLDFLGGIVILFDPTRRSGALSCRTSDWTIN